ncbi:type II secretion system F family protein [Marinomonas flavescens]|uniref:type II secretion system F family protein n=1 Tax=Marinomonas flavescens TaxID=2529379 RepID=UPI0010551024|nr:type II secretion system F family protein [Marinomonas flavescens]
MPWFSVKCNTGTHYHYASSESELLLHYVELGLWELECTVYKPKLFNYKTLLVFFCEIQSSLNNGFQLNEAINSLSKSSTNSALAKNCLVMTYELNAGKPFNKVLSRLSDKRCQPYCQLLVTDGSREDCEKSIETSIKQLQELLSWSSKLLKGMTYPFFIIQVALVINLLHVFFTENSLSQSLILNLVIYLITTLIQIIIVINFTNGNASNWFEKINSSFRLTKLLALLNASRKTGKPLQQALISMPLHFSHSGLKTDIISAYYSLQLGKSYQASFPSYWFPKESALALHAATKNGDIDRALTLAAQEHEQQCHRVIYWFEKIIPACCLFIAAGFVVTSLLTIYKPLLKLS